MSGFLCQSLLNFGRVFLCHKKRAVWFEVGPICSFFVKCKPIRLNLRCHTPKSKVFDKLCGQNAKDWLLGRRRRGGKDMKIPFSVYKADLSVLLASRKEQEKS